MKFSRKNQGLLLLVFLKSYLISAFLNSVEQTADFCPDSTFLRGSDGVGAFRLLQLISVLHILHLIADIAKWSFFLNLHYVQ